MIKHSNDFIKIKAELQKVGSGYSYKNRIQSITNKIFTLFESGLLTSDEYHELCDIVIKINMESIK